MYVCMYVCKSAMIRTRWQQQKHENVVSLSGVWHHIIFHFFQGVQNVIYILYI